MNTPRANIANALIEGSVLSGAFVAGIMMAPVFVLGLLIVLHGVYYLYSRQTSLKSKPLATRISLVAVAALIVAASYAIGWIIRFLVRGY
jgi:hypothetical protein